MSDEEFNDSDSEVEVGDLTKPRDSSQVKILEKQKKKTEEDH